MKPIIRLITLILLTSQNLHGKDYRFYYRETQLAEECLLNGEFGASLKHYDSAFTGYDFKFARDCYIAAQVAAYLKNDSLTYKYLVYSLTAGIRYQCLFQTRVLKNLVNTDLAKKLEKEADKYWKIYLSGIDTNLNKEFTERYRKEQAAKSLKDRSAYYKILGENIDSIFNLISVGRYPDEQILGLANSIVINIEAYFFAGTDYCLYGCGLATPTLKHYQYAYDYMGQKMIEAMYKGLVNPRTVVSIFIFSKSRICEYPTHRPENLITIEQTKDSALIFNLAFENAKVDTATANKNRDEWYLPRSGTKYTASLLLGTFGIATAIGEWSGDL